jgi:hypothetical protein
VVSGWSQSRLDDKGWSRVLSLLIDHREIVPIAVFETVQLLERGISQESGGIKEEALALATIVGLQAWTALLSREWPRREAQEWLTVAINDPAGILMQFKLRALVQIWRSAGDGWKGLPPDWRHHFAEVVRGQSWTAAISRVVLASQVQVLFAIDPGWTASEMPQVFTWDSDSLLAQQAWHGYLVWGR